MPLQGHAVQELHGNEGFTILLTDVMDGANIGMIQSGCGLRLALEAAQSLRISGDLWGQELQGDEPM